MACAPVLTCNPPPPSLKSPPQCRDGSPKPLGGGGGGGGDHTMVAPKLQQFQSNQKEKLLRHLACTVLRNLTAFTPQTDPQGKVMDSIS